MGRRFRSVLYAACLACGHPAAPVVALPAIHASAPPPPAPAIDRGEPPVVDRRIAWLPYDRERLELERRRGRPVLLFFTAAWSATCQKEEREILETPAVRDALVRANAAPLRVDVTNEDEARETLLESFGQNAVPAFVVIAPDGTHSVLPRPLTVESVVAGLAIRR